MGGGTIKLALTTLEHDHAWWTIDHVLAEPGARLVGIADPRPHLIEKARGRYPGIALYRSLQTLIEREKPDALIVTSANNEHRPILSMCADAGVHCMIQKPFATIHSDARWMASRAAESGIRLMVNCFPFWRPEFQEMSRRISAGELGRVLKVVAHHGHQGPRGIGVLTDDYLGWLYDPVRHGGGAFIDQGSYGVAYTVWMLGRPESVSAWMHTFKIEENTAVEDDAVAVLAYPGATAVIQGSFNWPFGRSEYEIYGPIGGFRLSAAGLSFERAYDPNDRSRKDIVAITPQPVPPERRNGIAAFVYALQSGGPFDAAQTVDLNLIVAEVVDAAYASNRTRAVAVL
jgi:predicted dehydrogenase